jgi:hypothetical protein
VPQTLTTPASSLDCGVPFLVQGSEYLIAGKFFGLNSLTPLFVTLLNFGFLGQRNGNTVLITSCGSFPFMDNSIPTGPTLWLAVAQDLKTKLQSGQF